MTERAMRIAKLRSFNHKSALLWMSLGTVARALSQWGVYFLLARLQGPESVGEYGLAMAVALPIMTLANMQLIRLQATDVNRRYEFVDYQRVRFVATIAGVTLLLGFVLVAGYPFSLVALTLVVALRMSVEAIAELYYGLFVQRERVDLQGKGVAFSSLSSFVVTVSLLLSGLELFWSLVGGVLAFVGVILVFHRRRANAFLAYQEGSIFHSGWQEGWIHVLREALPLGIVLLVVSATANAPKILLERYIGGYELGILVTLLALLSAGTLATDTLGQIATPSLSRKVASGETLGTLIGLLFAVTAVSAFGVALVAFILGPTVIGAVFGEEFTTSRFTIVIVSMIWGVQLFARFIDIIVVAARSIRINLIGSAIALLITLSVSVILIPPYSTKGAVVALLCGALVRQLSLLWAAIRLNQTRVTDHQQGGRVLQS